MGRKLGLGLPSLKIPDRKQQKIILSSDEHSPISPIMYIPRSLDPRTERELKAACAAIAKNYEPDEIDDQVLRDLQKYRRQEKENKAALSSDSRRSNLAPPLVERATSAPGKKTTKQSPSAKELLDEVNKGAAGIRTFGPPKPSGTEIIRPSEKGDSPRPVQASKVTKRKTSSSALSKPLKTAPVADSSEGSSAPSAGDSLQSVSTGLTSVVLTPAQCPKRARESEPADLNAPLEADAAAAEWMGQEREKRRLKLRELMPETTASNPAQQPPPPSRAMSRTRSFKEEIKGYIRSRGSSRPASRGAGAVPSETFTRGVSTEIERGRPSLDRAGSSHGWRSWGLQRKASFRSLASSRPGSSRADDETRGRDCEKKEINLNRALPPLPGLDQWDREEKKRKAQGFHIANLMQDSGDSKSKLDMTTSEHNACEAAFEPPKRATHDDASPITDTESRPRGRYSHSSSSSHSTQYTNDGGSTASSLLPTSTNPREPPAFPARKSSIAHRSAGTLLRNDSGMRMDSLSIAASPIEPHPSSPFPPSPLKSHASHKDRAYLQKPRPSTAHPVGAGRMSESDSGRRPSTVTRVTMRSQTAEITALPCVKAETPVVAKGKDGGLKKVFSMLALSGRRRKGQGEGGPGVANPGMGAAAPVVKF